MNSFKYMAPFYDWFMETFGFFKYKLIIEKLDLSGNDKILDVGGGTGFIAKKMAEISPDITVLDKTANMLKKASKRGLKTIDADALNLPFDDNTFDVITCIDALHHIKKHEMAVCEFDRVLKPGGRLFVLDFHQQHLLGKLVKLIEIWFIDDSKFISPEDFEKLMTKYGFVGETQLVSRFEYYYRGKKGTLN